MNIKIHYYGNFQKITQKEQEILECIENISLKEMILQLIKQYGEDFKKVVFTEKEQLCPALLVVVNNQTIDKAQPLVLKENDEIKLLIAIAGG